MQPWEIEEKRFPLTGGTVANLFLPIFSSSAREEFFEISLKFISNCVLMTQLAILQRKRLTCVHRTKKIQQLSREPLDSICARGRNGWNSEKGKRAGVEGGRVKRSRGLIGRGKRDAVRRLSADGDSLSTFSIGAERFRARSQSLRRGPWFVIYIPVARATRREGWQRRSNPNKGKKGVQFSLGEGVGLF